uniref:HVA22-like protein n=1 Tax=Oryza meridionalis TaxID=40149 RepID=A0A0E0DXG3_9ORYZ
MGSGSLLKVLAKNFDVLAGYASVKAIETKSPVDDQQWLTYWVMYSLITLFELTFASIIQWIQVQSIPFQGRLPFWPSMKLIFICWLVLPYFNGAAFVYQNYVRPMFVKHQMVNIWYVPQKKGLFGKSDDFLTALDKFIEENGPEALKKLTNKAGKSSKQSGKSWKDSKSSKESKDSKSSKESKEPKPSKDSKQPKPPKVLKESKPLKDSKEDKKAVKEDKKAAAKDSKEQKKALKDSKELKKALKDSKEQASQKDSDELKPKSNKRVTFAEVEPEKELKASNSDWHPTSEYHSMYPEHNSWSSSFMIFEDENNKKMQPGEESSVS